MFNFSTEIGFGEDMIGKVTRFINVVQKSDVGSFYKFLLSEKIDIEDLSRSLTDFD